MTATRDSDRIIRAWLDLMPDDVPERSLDAILEAVDAEPQRRSVLRGHWRNPLMNRLTLILATVMLGIAVLGGALLAGVGSPNRQSATPPPPAPAASASSGAGSPSASAAVPSSPVPDALRGTWTADSEPIPDLAASGPLFRFVVNTLGTGAWVQVNDDNPAALRSTSSATGDVLTLVLDRAANGCPTGAIGRYRTTISAGGLELAVAAIDDPCSVRRAAMERSWIRAHRGGPGGVALIEQFDPPFLVTLPPAAWTAVPRVDAIELNSPDLTVIALKDPQGFTEPCTTAGGKRRPIAPGLDAFEFYIRSLPGFTVTATDETIGGFPARHLAVVSEATADCPLGFRMAEFQPKAESGTLHWVLGVGDPDTMDIVELPDATVMIQLLAQNDAPLDREAILSSVRFLDAVSEAMTP